jgi:hypothetical protein
VFSGYIIIWALLNPGKTPQDDEKLPSAKNYIAAGTLFLRLADHFHCLGDDHRMGRRYGGRCLRCARCTRDRLVVGWS